MTRCRLLGLTFPAPLGGRHRRLPFNVLIAAGDGMFTYPRRELEDPFSPGEGVGAEAAAGLVRRRVFVPTLPTPPARS